jgi:hypothetical protein
MPFTLAHPAAAVPLLRPLRRLGNLTALVIGSMTPDLHYFLPLSLGRGDTHSTRGLLWFCMPLGIVLYLLFHRVFRAPLMTLLPAPIQRRLVLQRPAQGSRMIGATAVLVSLAIGSLTHLIWDSLTHRGGFPVQQLGFLRAPMFSVLTFPIFPYQLLQWASSVLGCLLLAVWISNWFRNAKLSENSRGPELPPGALILIWTVLMAGPAWVSIHAALPWPVDADAMEIKNLVRGLALQSIVSFLQIAIAYCLSWQLLTFRDYRLQNARKK